MEKSGNAKAKQRDGTICIATASVCVAKRGRRMPEKRVAKELQIIDKQRNCIDQKAKEKRLEAKSRLAKEKDRLHCNGND